MTIRKLELLLSVMISSKVSSIFTCVLVFRRVFASTLHRILTSRHSGCLRHVHCIYITSVSITRLLFALLDKVSKCYKIGKPEPLKVTSKLA